MSVATIALLIVGVFLGNWLVVPWLFPERNFKDGFFIGLIASAILTVAYGTAVVVKLLAT